MKRSPATDRRYGIEPEPKFTCPKIDAAGALLEEIRQANISLRDWGKAWKKLAIRKNTEYRTLLAKYRTLESQHQIVCRQLQIDGGPCR